MRPFFCQFQRNQVGIGGMNACDMQESYLADCRFKKMEWKGLNLKRAVFSIRP